MHLISHSSRPAMPAAEFRLWDYLMLKKSFTSVMLVSLFSINMPTFSAELEQSCKTLLDQTLHVWTLASISEEVRTFTAGLQIDPSRIRGDFDADGRQDIALLIQTRSQPIFEEPDRINSTRVAVCLAKKSSMVLRLIEKPYCDDYIYLMRKGEKMYDIEAGDLGKYPVDSIGTICFEKASAVFVLEGNEFKQIVNGD